MEEEKKLEKRKNIEIVVLGVIIVVLLGALIYLLFIKKDNPAEPPKPQDNQQINSNTSEEKLYSIIQGNSYELYEAYYKEGEKNITLARGPLGVYEITFDYPQINIDSNDIVSINNSIKSTFHDLETNINEKKLEEGICIKLNNNYHCDNPLSYPIYKIYEDDKYLNIIMTVHNIVHNGSGQYDVSSNIYTISKNRKKLLNNYDIYNLFGNNEDNVKNQFKNYLKTSNPNLEDKEIDETINNMKIYLYNDKLYIYYNNLVDDYEYISFDGKNFK